MGFHPAEDKPLVFAGDKLGNLGLFDGSQNLTKIKNEGADDDEDDDEDSDEPAITTFKIHTRTISAFQFSPHDLNALYSASYDSSIRKLDLAKGVATEVYAPSDSDIDVPISGVEMSRQDANMLYFSTLNGQFGWHDIRAPGDNTGGSELLQLSEKKIGGFSLHPAQPHIFATASLDRTLKIWDLRNMRGNNSSQDDDEAPPGLVGEHESRLSVSHAAFNSAGQVATASYDDTVKIYDFSDCAAWTPGTTLGEAQMKPKTVVPHNNQTGRWVTMYVFLLTRPLFPLHPPLPLFPPLSVHLLTNPSLRAQWQLQPSDGIQRFCIGSMNRFVDIYTATGQQLAQLGGEGISAVPAVAQFHPSRDWVCAGTASGKLCLWM